jgi:hypothetical protein
VNRLFDSLLAKAGLSNIAPNGVDDVEGHVLLSLLVINRLEVCAAFAPVYCHDDERSLQANCPHSLPRTRIIHHPRSVVPSDRGLMQEDVYRFSSPEAYSSVGYRTHTQLLRLARLVARSAANLSRSGDAR